MGPMYKGGALLSSVSLVRRNGRPQRTLGLPPAWDGTSALRRGPSAASLVGRCPPCWGRLTGITSRRPVCFVNLSPEPGLGPVGPRLHTLEVTGVALPRLTIRGPQSEARPRPYALDPCVAAWPDAMFFLRTLSTSGTDFL